jgi:hypothetical protein
MARKKKSERETLQLRRDSIAAEIEKIDNSELLLGDGWRNGDAKKDRRNKSKKEKLQNELSRIEEQLSQLPMQD